MEPEYKTMIKQIAAEAAGIQAEEAPIIEAKLNALIALMDAYTDRITELETVASRASRAYSPYSAVRPNYTGGISEYKTNPLEWFERFVFMYYAYADTARRSKSGGQWCK